MMELIQNSYEDCVTKVLCQQGHSTDITMKVGVKQGDSMSPLLLSSNLNARAGASQ